MKISNVWVKRALFSAATIATMASAQAGDQWSVNFDRGAGSVEFLATGKPSMIKINGKGEAPKGSLTVDGSKVSGQMRFSLDSLDTGIALRNTHMKSKYLHTDKHPEAILTMTKVALPATKSTGDFSFDKVAFEGNLQLHGVTRPIRGIAKISRAGGKISVETSFGLTISDYKIDIPSFAGVTVAKDVTVQVRGSAPVEAGQAVAKR
jgi:polyisoprenoid-binding protein YceI